MATYRADINVAERRGHSRRSAFAMAMVGLVVAMAALVFGVARAYLLSGMPTLPDKATMWQMNLAPTITLVDRNGVVIGHRGPWIGEPLKLNDMPAYLPNAFLAIEDERFFEHEGVDNKAILRAMISNARSGQRSQGGSTLTQQLVKIMILTPEKTYRRKFQEALLARDLEAILSKPEILELYINRISLGPQIFGAEAASQRYFGKSARDLTLAEAALLAGLAQAPSRYNPVRNLDRALARSRVVLERMRVNMLISELEYEAALANPPQILEESRSPIDERILGYAFDYLSEDARRRAGPRYPDLVVTSTLDAKLMKSAHETLNEVLDKSGETRNVSQGAVLTLDNQTGGILAMIGGRNYLDSMFNRTTQAQRQPGSSFKTFVYAAAFEDGFTPATVRIDQKRSIGGWEPENYTLRYRGPITIREALKLSINTVAAQVGAEIGPSRIVATAKRFGITSPLKAHLSLSLGSSEVNLMELTAAYSVFINEGLLRQPYMIERIETTSGEELYNRTDRAGDRVYPLPYAEQITSILQETLESGTAHGARLPGRPAGGKTGTSQDYRDAWFIGFTGQMTTGIWMGNDNNSTMNEVTGGLLPADVFKAYMTEIHEGEPIVALTDLEVTPADARASEMMAFYLGLAAALRNERDLAAGVRPPPAPAPAGQ